MEFYLVIYDVIIINNSESNGIFNLKLSNYQKKNNNTYSATHKTLKKKFIDKAFRNDHLFAIKINWLYCDLQ